MDEEGAILGRFVGLGRLADGNVEYTDDDRLLIAPSLTLKPDEGTYLTILGSYQKNNALTVTNYPWAAVNGSSPYGRMPTERYLGEPDFDRETQEQINLGYEFFHEFNSEWRFKQNFRYLNFENRDEQGEDACRQKMEAVCGAERPGQPAPAHFLGWAAL